MAKYELDDNDGNLEKLAAQLEKIQGSDIELVDNSDTSDQRQQIKVASSPQQVMPIVFAGVVGVIILVALALFLWSRNQSNATSVIVPNVVGQQLPEARKAMDDVRLKLTLLYDSSSTLPSGTVISTNPAAATRMPVGSSVSITVAGSAPAMLVTTTTITPPTGGKPGSAGSTTSSATSSNSSTTTTTTTVAMRTIPDLTNLTEDAARQILGSLGLRVTVARGENKKLPNNVVLATNPVAGVEVCPGSDVEITVNFPATSTSTVTPPVPTPTKVVLKDYVGKSGAIVMEELKANGFKVEVRIVSTNITASGNVISTDPPAGKLVSPGDKITVTVAK